jgi:hypothetical protein
VAAKFTVIPGGGGGREPPDVLQARHHLRRLIVEILRALVRGDDYGARVIRELSDFTRYANESGAPIGTIVDPVLAELQERIAGEGGDEDTDLGTSYMDEISDIVLGSLMVAAELFSRDGFAKARLADRTLQQA